MGILTTPLKNLQEMTPENTEMPEHLRKMFCELNRILLYTDVLDFEYIGNYQMRKPVKNPARRPASTIGEG